MSTFNPGLKALGSASVGDGGGGVDTDPIRVEASLFLDLNGFLNPSKKVLLDSFLGGSIGNPGMREVPTGAETGSKEELEQV